MSETTYQVAGMTCDHCVNSVRTKVAQVPGVREVAADLTAGSVKVAGDSVDDEAIREGITEAGYKTVGV